MECKKSPDRKKEVIIINIKCIKISKSPDFVANVEKHLFGDVFLLLFTFLLLPNLTA